MTDAPLIPTGGRSGESDPARAARYNRVPWLHMMEWQKPA